MSDPILIDEKKNGRTIDWHQSAAHWGVFDIGVMDGAVTHVRPSDKDPDPAEFCAAYVGIATHPLRIAGPMVRAGYLRNGRASDGAARGVEPFVRVGWDTALTLIGEALNYTIREYGNEAIFAGSYGWASAGRFHHAPSQLHRFLNCIGGYVGHRNTYSTAAAEVLLSHVLGDKEDALLYLTDYCTLAENCRQFLCFGGIGKKNTQVNVGGTAAHRFLQFWKAVQSNGSRVISVSPVRDDSGPESEWLAIRPGSDGALMLALCHWLIVNRAYDHAFVTQYCQGFDWFAAHVLGQDGSGAKTADWAAEQTGLSAPDIERLAQNLSREPSYISVSWSLQRADHGEYVIWCAVALAALLGHIGTERGGIGVGFGAVDGLAAGARRDAAPTFPLGRNPVATFIPVARIADALLHPGRQIPYDGGMLTLPDLRLIWWAGGNPFHHHQDLNRLREAWALPNTIIVQDPWWTATARHADIVLPSTLPFERSDIAFGKPDSALIAMSQAVAPPPGIRGDFDMLCDLADHLGVGEAFHERRDADGWLREIYRCFRTAAPAEWNVPDYDAFLKAGRFDIPATTRRIQFQSFRRDPSASPLATRSGRIELYIPALKAAGLSATPTWFAPREWLGATVSPSQLHLLSNQPRNKLHSQLDFAGPSQSLKKNGFETLRLHPSDATARGIADGDPVRLFNARGACLAVAEVSDQILPGVVLMSTGGWYAPVDASAPDSLDLGGNPNVLTADTGTCALAQGPSVNSCLIEVEPYPDAPKRHAARPPEILSQLPEEESDAAFPTD